MILNWNLPYRFCVELQTLSGILSCPMDRIKNSSDVGNLVHTQRKVLKLIQVEATGLCGVGVRFWSKLEHGKGPDSTLAPWDQVFL